MTLAPDAARSACYLRLLANWGLGMAGLPLAVEDDEDIAGKDAEPEVVAATAQPPKLRN